ncbi:hypothetical protein [Natronomonas salsuginis]|jgi:hypothetical protein|uniref:Uncharacterized protein n=1 Tax=Natronomonas salsuginis TaxID=2217661 RepID=A0A4U5JCT3_9EURY|nr:hypothetical protein [Natronomonas salsuginis]TKR26425.1 hypothetical protein DM868_08040 [Natronomonas salsuginis]
MLNLNLDSFMIELKDGSIKNVGPTNKSASAKLFDVESAEARAFGDSQVKIVATDASGNEVQIALSPDAAEAVVDDIESLREESGIFE